MRVAGWCGFGVFAWLIAVELGGADPFTWVALYGYPALLGLIFGINRVPTAGLTSWSGPLYAGFALAWYPWSQPFSWASVDVHEAAGLLAAALWMGGMTLLQRVRARGTDALP